MQATPFDNLGAMMPSKELIGLMSFNFDLIIPGAQTIWHQQIDRTDEDIADLLFATPYQYTMRHRFPKPLSFLGIVGGPTSHALPPPLRAARQHLRALRSSRFPEEPPYGMRSNDSGARRWVFPVTPRGASRSARPCSIEPRHDAEHG